MNRREALRLSLPAALMGTAPNEAQATQTVAAKTISLPELPPKPPKDIASKLFPAFVQTEVRTSGASIPVLHKGDGPPLLLLHGFPETHVTWHKVAPRLAERFSVYVPDLRGYGDSSRPTDGDRHINYSFRAMALDQIETMRHFGHEQFFVGSHDRGARRRPSAVSRLSQNVTKVCLMDIAPGTLTMYRQTNQEFATRCAYVVVLPYPSGAPMPETFHRARSSSTYLEVVLGALNKTLRSYHTRDSSERVSSMLFAAFIDDPMPRARISRASADIGLEMDEADDRAGNKIVAPVHVLWGAKNTVGQEWDILATWRERKATSTVTGHSLDCGHFLQEERPEETLEELQNFFGAV